ncbi:MAG TPA: hypothetical protein VEX86_04815 [Longimicrobium sp.]|nr:hypothetical protein [Longimicrobium sp.]
MKRFAWSAAVAAASLASFGCRAAVNPAPVAGAAGNGCSAAVASADVSGWRSVEADGFTFCVPPDWSVGGSGRSWSRGTARVTWGLGRTVAAADVPAMAQASSQPAFACTGPSKGARIHPRPEMIGGRQAQVWRSRVRQGFYTGGHWSAPHFYIVGEASDAATADLEMTILRTARVASR